MTLLDTHCAVCGARLTLHQRARGPTCDGWRCRERALGRALEAHRAEAAAALGVERPADYALFVVPRNERPVVPLPAQRKRKFRAHLRRAAAAAARGDGEAVPAPEGPADVAEGEGGFAPLPDAETRLLGQACAACRGTCCKHGREHAFLGGLRLARYLAAHPDGTPRQAVEAYLAHLPEESFEGACVYQGTRGCTLPRALRADLCNAYHCAGLKSYRRHLVRHGPTPGCAVVREDNRIEHSAFFDAERMRRYESAARPARRRRVG
jgi:hypothetical protein